VLDLCNAFLRSAVFVDSEDVDNKGRIKELCQNLNGQFIARDRGRKMEGFRKGWTQIRMNGGLR
jgi:hypothetical protein